MFPEQGAEDTALEPRYRLAAEPGLIKISGNIGSAIGFSPGPEHNSIDN